MNSDVSYYFANVIRISNSDSAKYCFRKRNPVHRDMFPGELVKGLLSLGVEGRLAPLWKCWLFKWRVARSECFSRSHYVTIRIRGHSKLPVLKGWRVSPSCEHVPFVRACRVRKRYWFSRFLYYLEKFNYCHTFFIITPTVLKGTEFRRKFCKANFTYVFPSPFFFPCVLFACESILLL